MQPYFGRLSLGQAKPLSTEQSKTQPSPSTASGIVVNNNPDLPSDSHLVTAPILVAAHAKNGHLYLFRYTRQYSTELMRHIGQVAASQETDFSWYDAAKVTKSIRDLNHAADNLV